MLFWQVNNANKVVGTVPINQIINFHMLSSALLPGINQDLTRIMSGFA
jgi:hypothetical protein